MTRDGSVTVELPRKEARILSGMLLSEQESAQSPESVGTYATMRARLRNALDEQEGDR